jgi:hypothetical protein
VLFFFCPEHFTTEMDYDQTAVGLPLVTSAVFVLSSHFVTMSLGEISEISLLPLRR